MIKTKTNKQKKPKNPEDPQRNSKERMSKFY